MLSQMKKDELVQHATNLTVSYNELRNQVAYLAKRVAQLEAEQATTNA
jgi:allophanate hydrolase subunit 1